MSKSTSETGNAVNISNYKLLIDTCTGFEGKYNPSNEDITLPNMTAQWTKANGDDAALSEAEAEMKEPVNERVMLFTPLSPLITQVMGAVDSSKMSDLLKQDAKGIADKIRGFVKRAKKAPDGGTTTEPIDSVSQSHQSFVQRADALLDLINLLKTAKEYKPNEEPLKLTSLTDLQKKMKEANDGIGVIIDKARKAQLSRNRTLYKRGSGMVEMAQVCKDYVKSVYGTKAAEYKSVTAIKFRDLPKKEKDKL